MGFVIKKLLFIIPQTVSGVVCVCVCVCDEMTIICLVRALLIRSTYLPREAQQTERWVRHSAGSVRSVGAMVQFSPVYLVGVGRSGSGSPPTAAAASSPTGSRTPCFLTAPSIAVLMGGSG